MKSNAVCYLLFLVLFVQSSCKKDASISLDTEPVFFTKATVDGNFINLIAGKDNYRNSPYLHNYNSNSVYESYMDESLNSPYFVFYIGSLESNLDLSFSEGDYSYPYNDSAFSYSNGDTTLVSKEVVINYQDKNGDLYYSNYVDQTGSSFKIISVENYYEWDDFDKRNRFLKVHVQFSCKLVAFYNEVITVENGETVLVFGNETD